jgi:radical SAM protein with 4Fe4S-binding SPASM domain
MFYRQKFDTFIRTYDDIGYITNQSDFGDRVTDSSGAIFIKALSRRPKSLQEITNEIAKSFIDVDPSELENDIIGFYSVLEEDGFIVSGETDAELDKKDIRFSYSSLAPKTKKRDYSPIISRASKTTQEFLEEHFKDKPHLKQFQIEITSRCNERCVHCYIPHENKLDEIDPLLFCDILDQCAEMGVLNITISGGEPFLHKEFCDFIETAKKHDFSINVLSNLTLLNDEIISELKTSRLSTVQVSLYSLNPDIHDSITKVRGSFQKTKNSILKLIENDIPLQISCPTMKQNKDSYADVLNWAYEHKVRAVTDYIIMARYDKSIDNLDNRLSLDEVGIVISDIINNDLEYQKEIIRSDIIEQNYQERDNDIVCGICISSICMNAKGNIFPCAGWQDYIVGNVKETPLKEIWDNSPKVQYLRGLRKKDFPKCTGCEDRGFCAMCMVRNANENLEGNPLKINDHFCKVAALNRKIVLDWKAKLEADGV